MDQDSAFPALIRALPTTEAAVPAHRLEASACDVLFIAASADTDVPWHQHETDNATVILSGAITLVTDDGEKRCGPGEWYETRAGEMHAIRFEADTTQIELRFAAGQDRQ